MRKIILVQLGRLGDVVASRIALHSLAARFGVQNVEVVVSEESAEVFHHEPWPVRIHRYPRQREDWRGVLRFLWRLRRERPSIVVDSTGSTRSRWLALASGAGERWGWGRKWLYHRGTAERRRDEANYSLEIARLLESCGVPAVLELPNLTAPEPVAGWVGRVILHPGSANLIRRWRGDRFARLALRLKAAGVEVGIVAGLSERAWAEELAAASGAPLILPSSLGELMALLRGARLLVGVDSGPMHLGAALGTRVLALFGPNLPSRAAPARGAVDVLEVGLECRPCRQVLSECVHPNNNCMDRIEVDSVARKVFEIL